MPDWVCTMNFTNICSNLTGIIVLIIRHHFPTRMMPKQTRTHTFTLNHQPEASYLSKQSVIVYRVDIPSEIYKHTQTHSNFIILLTVDCHFVCLSVDKGSSSTKSHTHTHKLAHNYTLTASRNHNASPLFPPSFAANLVSHSGSCAVCLHLGAAAKRKSSVAPWMTTFCGGGVEKMAFGAAARPLLADKHLRSFAGHCSWCLF